jgi:hypothetical protein
MVLILGLLAFPVFAQEAAENPTINFSFKAIAFSRVAGLDEVFHGEKEEKTGLRLPTRNFSAVAEYKGKNPVVFYGRRMNEEGEIDHFPVAAVNIDKEWKQVILIFLPANRQVGAVDRRFEVLAVDAELARFQGGGRHFVNVSGIDVAANINGQKFFVGAGRSSTFAPRVKGDPSTRVPVQFHFRKEGEWHLLSSTRWGMDSRLRTLVFIYEDPRRKRLALRGITDRLP